MSKDESVTSDQGSVDPIITASTRTTLRVVGSVALVLLAALGYMESWKADQRNRFAQIDKALEKQDRRMEKLEESTQRFMLDLWTHSDMKLWVLKLGKANPDMPVPEPKK